MQQFERSAQIDRSRLLERLIQILSALLALAFLVSGIVYNYASRWLETRLDFWRIYKVCLTHSAWESAVLKSNNHSIFFPSLIWLADIRFLHNNQELLFFAGIFFQIASAVLILIPVWKDELVSVTARLLATLVVIVGVFWMGRATITDSGGFNCMCSLALCGAVLAFPRLRELEAGRSYWGTFLTIVAAGCLASFSFGCGLAVWPTLVILAWALSLRRRSLVLLILAGISAALIYKYLPGSTNSSLPFKGGTWVITTAAKSLFRLCMLLGTPILYSKAAWSAQPLSAAAAQSSLLSLAAGAGGLAFAAWAIVPRLVRRDLAESKMELMGIGLILFNIGGMLLIIVGRAVDFRVHPEEVAAARYIFWTSMFWAGVLLLAIRQFEAKPCLRWPLLLIVLGLPVMVFPEHRRQAENGRYGSSLAEAAATSLINGVRAPTLIPALSGIPSQVYDLAPKFRARRLDMFADGWQDLIGLQVSDFKRGFRSMSLRGALKVDALLVCDNGDPGARIQGWGIERNDTLPEALLIIDSQGTVRGVARPTTVRSLTRWLSPAEPGNNVFVGYIRDYDPNSQYVARSSNNRRLSRETIVVQPEAKLPGS